MDKTPKSYAILRVKPLKSWAAVAAMTKHGQRIGADIEHVDQSKTGQNRFNSEWDHPTDIRSCIEAVARFHRARWRKGAPVASHLLLTASPTYFRPDNPDAAGQWDNARLEQWLDHNMKWLNQKWPDQVACWRLDLDESTPHLDVFIVPVSSYVTKTGKRVTEVSHRKAFGFDRQSFAKLQDDYAVSMQSLGLLRGQRRVATKAFHVNPAEYRRRLQSEHQRQRGTRIGIAGLLRGDISQIRHDDRGNVAADFAESVPFGIRDRFLGLVKPAVPELIEFERRLLRTTKRFVQDVVRELIVDAESDRKTVIDLVADLEYLRDKMLRLNVTAPVDLVMQLERAHRQLVR